MKKIYALAYILLISLSGFAQSGDGFKYQAVIRDANGNINANANVSMEFSILQGSVDGSSVFSETHNVVSNPHGIINLVIGSQNPGSFALINWANGPYFIQISIDGIAFGTSELMSVPYALHSKTTENYNESDPLFSASPLASVTQEDVLFWSNKIDSIIEVDPLFAASPSASITEADIASWMNKLSEFVEADPLFSASVAKGITSADTAYWNSKFNELIETDPIFATSIAKGISGIDTAYWNSKLDTFDETDPIFTSHPTSGITEDDITKWKALWIWYTTNAQGYLTATNSVAGGITAADTALWNSGGASGGIESDPIFGASIAKGITGSDTTYWNNKLSAEVDASITNEIQTLSISNDTIYLTDGGIAKLPAEVDASITNEIQTLSISNDTIYLTDGGSAKLPAEVDGSITNEIQTLSISNDTIYLTDGGIAKLPAEVDASITNEIQTLSISNDTIYLTDGGIAKLPAEVDASITNEIQTLSISNDTIYLTDGGIAKLPAEVDASITNEIQTLSISNDTIYLTSGGSVKLPASSGGASQLSELSDVSSSTKTAGNLLIADGSADFASVAISGDAALAANGTLTIADNSVDGTDIYLGSETEGDIMYYNSSGNWVRLAAGTAGQLLQTNGTAAPSWVAAPSGGGGALTVNLQNGAYTVLTTDDLVYTSSGSNTYTLPTAASAGAGKIIYLSSIHASNRVTIATAGGDVMSDVKLGGTKTTYDRFSSTLISAGGTTWIEISGF